MNIPMIPKNHSIRDTEPSREVASGTAADPVNAQDKVSIGEESRIVSRLVSRLKEIQNAERPDLESLKNQIKSGEYKPSAIEIARAILFGPPRNK
jgi:anti-sigma28 factor (negative regulator of flagellin synthesis)